MPYRKGIGGRAERLHSKVVRGRKGFCERCGDRSGPFECAHIVKRWYAATRTDESNGWCLCGPCHRIVDNKKSEFLLLIEKTCGLEKLIQLEQKARAGVKTNPVFWRIEIDRLQAILDNREAW